MMSLSGYTDRQDGEGHKIEQILLCPKKLNMPLKGLKFTKNSESSHRIKAQFSSSLGLPMSETDDFVLQEFSYLQGAPYHLDQLETHHTNMARDYRYSGANRIVRIVYDTKDNQLETTIVKRLDDGSWADFQDRKNTLNLFTLLDLRRRDENVSNMSHLFPGTQTEKGNDCSPGEVGYGPAVATQARLLKRYGHDILIGEAWL